MYHFAPTFYRNIFEGNNMRPVYHFYWVCPQRQYPGPYLRGFKESTPAPEMLGFFRLTNQQYTDNAASLLS